MKIALLCDDTLDTTDGVQQYVLTLGAWLASDGHEVHYLTSETARTDIPNIHSLAGHIRVRFNGNRNNMPLPARTKAVRTLLAKEKFDIIHVQMPYSPLLAGRIIALAPKQTKIIGTFHVFPENKLMTVGTWLLGSFVKRQLKRFDALLAVSTAAQDFAKQTFRIDTQIVPNMTGLSNFPAPKDIQGRKTVKIVFLGRLVERKGSIYLLQALNELVRMQPEIKKAISVVIAGKGPLMDSLQAYARDTGLDTITEFPGYIAEADKADLLASADIAVFPSTGGESFGISLIEAMSATPGPVIAGDNAGYRTVMEGAEAQLIKPEDTKAFARLLNTYISDAGLRKKAHVWQQTHVSQYDTPKVGAQIVQVYTDVLRDARK
jgi:phosphatidyl-myo-inositol alpha-mannosyltransferase